MSCRQSKSKHDGVNSVFFFRNAKLVVSKDLSVQMIHPHVFQKWSVGIPMMDRFVGPAHKVSREMANFVNEMLAVKIHAMLESTVMIPILRPSLDVDRALKDTGEMASLVSQQLVNRDLHLVSRFAKKKHFQALRFHGKFQKKIQKNFRIF
jgi:hypothetical protein